MTETQIKLYAALRVAVPLKWRIRGETVASNIYGWPPTQIIEFSRVAGPRNGGRYVDRYRMQIDGRSLQQAPQHTIRNAVLEAQRHVGCLETRATVSVTVDGKPLGEFTRADPPRLTRADLEERPRLPRQMTRAEFAAELMKEMKRAR